MFRILDSVFQTLEFLYYTEIPTVFSIVPVLEK